MLNLEEKIVYGLISIIVPVYNTEKYLEQCIKSLINQTYSSLEIIVVNDGSTDSSMKRIEELTVGDSRTQIISQDNTGLSGARNSGLKKASGEYVMFLDSDDWIELDTCERAIKEIQQENADVVMWTYLREYNDKAKWTGYFGDKRIVWDTALYSELHRRMVGPIHEELNTPHYLDSMITVWGKLYRHIVLKNIQFVDTKIIGTEDALYNIEVFKNVQKAVYLPDALSHYRKNDLSSLSHSYKRNKVDQWKELYQRIQTILDSSGLTADYYEALENRISLGLIGLGLNIAEDKQLGVIQKMKELKRILSMPHYQKALKQLRCQYMPMHWKLFFTCGKCQFVFPLTILLIVMNRMRNK